LVEILWNQYIKKNYLKIFNVSQMLEIGVVTMVKENEVSLF